MEELKKKFKELINKFGLFDRLPTFNICSENGVEIDGSTIDAITKEGHSVIFYYNENIGDCDDITAFKEKDLQSFYNDLNHHLSVKMAVIEDWWKHNGAYDREQASPHYWDKGREDVGDYFAKTDKWWESLSNGDKMEVYEDFFTED